MRRDIEQAVELGATDDEIMEVLELSATLGIHAANAGVPILLEVLAETGDAPDVFALDARQQQFKADFEANRGYWNPIWDGVLKLSPDFFEAYLEYSSVPWKHGVLEPKVKELIYSAFDCSRDAPLAARPQAAHAQRARLRRDAARDHGGDPDRERARRPRLRVCDARLARGARRGRRLGALAERRRTSRSNSSYGNGSPSWNLSVPLPDR